MTSRTVRALGWAPLAAAILAVAACKGSESTPAAVGPADIGGTMVIATPAEPGTLLPLLVSSLSDRITTDLLYDRLAEIPQDLNTVGDKGYRPQLAESWEWSKDSLSIAFHLNPKARWHDGQPVRASDVRFTVNLVKDPAAGAPMMQLIQNVDSISVRDSLTPVAWFKRHTPEQFYDLVYQVPIVPEHLLSNIPAAQLRTSEVSRKGIGSGRFRLGKWEAGQRLELVADTGNYRGRAKLDRVVWSKVPDATAAATRFFSGDADMYELLRPEHLAQLKGDTVRHAVPYPSLSYTYLGMNLVDPSNSARPHPIFGDKAVRRALSMAVDRRAMLQNVFGSYGQISYGPFPHAMGVVDTTLPQIGYDTVRARALLDSAGWVMGPGGVRTKGGHKLEFSIITPNSSAPRKAYAVLLQDAFKKIGVSVKIDESDYPTYVAKQGARTFDASMVSYGTDPSVSGFKQSWGAAGIVKDGPNFTGYSNPVVDALLDSAITTFDVARTKSYTRRALETIMDDAPGIWLYEPMTMAGIDKRIHLTAMRADGYWSGMDDWWIPASQRTARDKIGLRPAN